ncbi:Oxygen regulatory protein NreC [Serratia grimesii]|uniref:helix-turn-helix transcriptional regulator n=1 Tax=Serratia grimesii TaxID=82995 RepID=UPI00076F384E|nr:helix-turn-helix transcriptional regulator [Serratia grimesii]CUW13429.1 Oxygen regulatory protein NreC [Serratia grimesii]SMZ56360.1 Oxygen regulatory protein NreC [Serratia grimesii]
MGNSSPISTETLAWHRAFGQLVDNLDGPDFWLNCTRLLRGHLPFENWVALLFSPQHPPQILAASDESDGCDEALFDDYQKGLYLLDPFYLDAWARQRSGLLRLDDVAPANFTATEYYQRYFNYNVGGDEVQFNLLVEPQRMLCLSLGASQRYNDHHIGVLELVKSWLLPLMRQRIRFENTNDDGDGNFSLSSLPVGVQLTERENQVSQLMLAGCSTKEIARRLQISIETVRAHKKHLYSKLSINTQSELFALFWRNRGA